MTRMALVKLVLCAVVCMVWTVSAAPAATWTVDDDGVECPTADFAHPQDAVNAADPYDTIRVYPGLYTERVFTAHRDCCDTAPYRYLGTDCTYAPALIVYKDGLTIEAVDKDPSKTTIETIFPFVGWSWRVAVQASTGGSWDCPTHQYVGSGVYPNEPHEFNMLAGNPTAVTIIANDVTVKGFTLRSSQHYATGVLIGGLFHDYGLTSTAGDGDHLGCHNNTVVDCVIETDRYGVYIWHSGDNTVLNNTITTPSNSYQGITVSDGYYVESVALQPSSQWNRILNNTLTLGKIFVGWGYTAGTPTTDNTGTRVLHNSAYQIWILNSRGRTVFAGNSVNVAPLLLNSPDAKYAGPPPG
jgi:parallel beta-helix repeat protein